MTRPTPDADRMPMSPILGKADELIDQVRRCFLDLRHDRYCWLHGNRCQKTDRFHVVFTRMSNQKDC